MAANNIVSEVEVKAELSQLYAMAQSSTSVTSLSVTCVLVLRDGHTAE